MFGRLEKSSRVEIRVYFDPEAALVQSMTKACKMCRIARSSYVRTCANRNLNTGVPFHKHASYVNAFFDRCRWMIRSALVNPFSGNLERIFFSFFLSKKRLVYFPIVGDRRRFPTDPILGSKSVRVKIGPAGDYDRIRLVCMLHFRVPSR